ncbi:recombinase family protein [Actinoplanes sp. NPDC051411]|uniref:recombinase family protein n=1 Tax=Actinoplanes sp. NPDC051411 TaxID=3155522 RepID=UPI0034138B8D
MRGRVRPLPAGGTRFAFYGRISTGPAAAAPDIGPVTASHVRWIFARRLEGRSPAAIARMLNERRVPPPGAYDQIRNPHRQQTLWTWRTVAALFVNPRYTGRTAAGCCRVLVVACQRTEVSVSFNRLARVAGWLPGTARPSPASATVCVR